MTIHGKTYIVSIEDIHEELSNNTALELSQVSVEAMLDVSMGLLLESIRNNVKVLRRERIERDVIILCDSVGISITKIYECDVSSQLTDSVIYVIEDITQQLNLKGVIKFNSIKFITLDLDIIIKLDV